MVRYEIGIWRSLGIWLLRLRTLPRDSTAHPYAGVVTPLFIVFIAVSAIELPILHLVLPWPPVRTAADILSIWGLVWMIGLLAAVRVHPHGISDAGIRIRNGFSVDVTVPWDLVASVRSRGRSVERNRTVQCEQTPAGAVAIVAVAKQTTVEIVLRSPTVLPLARLGGEPVTEVRLFADDPGAMVASIRQRLVGSPDVAR